MTTPSSWSRVKQILEAALDRPPVERAEFVVRTCGDDAGLRGEVESLLAAIGQAGAFIEPPPALVLKPGDSLQQYQVNEFLGAGGMGEVYRARDGQLNRDVALKVRSASVTQDSDRLARFRREAHLLASLNHPNIAAIYGFAEADGVQALVLELIEGPTLASRMSDGALPIGEALSIAKQIAEGLKAAHERGVIHRDLKPANIKVRSDGAVKILDFGLAKALDASDSSSALPAGADITSASITHAGGIFGMRHT